jgi:hypothetical protein
MDKCDLPPELREDDVFYALLICPSVRDYIRDNCGLYHPPGDYAALRRENLRRTAVARRTSP